MMYLLSIAAARESILISASDFVPERDRARARRITLEEWLRRP